MRPSRPLRGEEELVLLAAATGEQRGATATRIAQLAARADGPTLVAELARQRLVPLLGARILAAAGAAAPAALREAVEIETPVARVTGELMELVTLRVAAALEAEGVRVVPLKGPLLARAVHGDAAMRASRDIDLLVARQDLGRAISVLGPLGWRPDPTAAAPVLHARLIAGGRAPDVELHWRVHWYEDAFAAAALERSAPGRDGIRRLRPKDEVAALLLFHARDGFAGLRHATDAAAWYDAHAAVRRPLVDEALGEHPALERALTASAVVLESLVGIPSRALVPATDGMPWGVRRAAGFANPLMRGSPAQVLAEIALVDVLLAPAGRRRSVLRRRALPGERQLPLSSDGRSLASRRAGHLLRLAARCAFALARPARVPPPATRSGWRFTVPHV